MWTKSEVARFCCLTLYMYSYNLHKFLFLSLYQSFA